MTLTCPKCGKEIPAASVNMTQGIAFCAACGETHQISALVTPAPAQETVPQQAATQNAVTTTAPDTVLVKGLVYAWFFQPDQTFSWSRMIGKCEVTSAYVRFVPYALMGSEWIKTHTVVMPIADIIEINKTGSLPPEIVIATNSGHRLTIRGYVTVKKVLNILKQLTGL